MAMQHSARFLALVEAARERIRELTVHEVAAMQARGDDFLFVDVREDREWDVDRARGAVHLGKGVLERDIEGLCPDLDRPVVLYCGGGFRSALAAESLERMGYAKVYSMAGGIRAWREAGLPRDEG